MSYNVKVLGFGDNVVDKYEHIKTMYPGGNAVNFAVFAKKLGAERSAYMGIFGSDKEAEHVIASLQEEGVELVKCKQVVGENGAARVTVNPENGDRIFLGSNEGGIRGDMLYALDRFSIEYVKGFDLVHSGNYCFTASCRKSRPPACPSALIFPMIPQTNTTSALPRWWIMRSCPAAISQRKRRMKS